MFQLVGVDVYLRSEGVPEVPREHGPFKLIFISNRGTRVWPNKIEGFSMIDWPRCRYEADGEISDNDVEGLVSALTHGGFTWTKCQKLYRKDGENQYSQPY